MHSNKLTPSRTVVTSFTPRQKASSQIPYSTTTKKAGQNYGAMDPMNGSNGNIENMSSSTPYDEGDWILCMACSTSLSSSTSSTTNYQSQSSTVSCALSNGLIQVYDQSSLLPITSYRPMPESKALISDMKYGPGGSNDTATTLLSTGNDGSIVLKDLRQSTTTIANTTNISHLLRNSRCTESALALALGYDGYIIAVSSSKGHIHFIELRKMMSINVDHSSMLLGSYVNSHSKAVTQIEFHPENPSVLLSGGEDGLVCIYNTTQPSEEKAIINIVNTGIPCRKVGFCSTNTLYCLSGSETVGIWDWNTGLCVNDFNNFQLRDNLSTIASLPIHYLVDAKWDTSNKNLHICAGNYEGNMAIFTHNTEYNKFWELNDMLIGGHHGIVRTWCPTTTTIATAVHKSIYFSGGEDARICEWDRTNNIQCDSSIDGTNMALSEMESVQSVNNPNRNNHSTVKVGGPIRRQRRSSKTSGKPY